jgi:hypothetical protein
VLNLNLPPCCHIPLSYTSKLDIQIIHHGIQTMCSHSSCCHHCPYYHYCNIDFVLFHSVTGYTNSPLSCIHVNTLDLLNITCTSATTCVILERSECTVNVLFKKPKLVPFQLLLFPSRWIWRSHVWFLFDFYFLPPWRLTTTCVELHNFKRYVLRLKGGGGRGCK